MEVVCLRVLLLRLCTTTSDWKKKNGVFSFSSSTIAVQKQDGLWW